jgi:hypothetical protein
MMGCAGSHPRQHHRRFSLCGRCSLCSARQPWPRQAPCEGGVDCRRASLVCTGTNVIFRNTISLQPYYVLGGNWSILPPVNPPSARLPFTCTATTQDKRLNNTMRQPGAPPVAKYLPDSTAEPPVSPTVLGQWPVDASSASYPHHLLHCMCNQVASLARKLPAELCQSAQLVL